MEDNTCLSYIAYTMAADDHELQPYWLNSLRPSDAYMRQ